MGMKKKKNIIILTLCVGTSFILYQLYFFFTITSANADSSKVVPVLNSNRIDQYVHLRSEADKFINNDGVIRGVLQQHMVHYRPNSKNEFKCLKSKQLIPFDRVNDDYCDCEDGSDEPSTNACPTGTFACDYQSNKRPKTLSSGKVNDGICDCCDGSDEYLHKPGEKVLSLPILKLRRIGPHRHYAMKCAYSC